MWSARISIYRYSLIGLCIVFLGLGIGSTVLAAWGDVATDSFSDAMFNFLWAGLNFMYIISMPLLVLAGKAIDNSMIYGEFLGIDRALYMLWNMSRVLANFAIWWILLWKVISFLFKSTWGNAAWEIGKILINGVITIIGINISWFGVGALIDLSTIATYSLGALPLNTIKHINGGKDMPILSISSYLDYKSEQLSSEQLDNTIKPYLYYQRGNINIPNCVSTYNIIVWPQYYPTIPNKPDISFEGRNVGENPTQYCAINSTTIADITQLQQRKDEKIVAQFGNSLNNEEKNQIMKSIIKAVAEHRSCENQTQIAWPNGMTWAFSYGDLYSWSRGRVLSNASTAPLTFCEENPDPIVISTNAFDQTQRQSKFLEDGDHPPYSNQFWQTINNLINDSKGMVWPFVTLYMSMLDFSNLSIIDTHNSSLYRNVGGLIELLLKWAISIWLMIPLIAIAIILILRVVLLWALIAFTPLWIAYLWLKSSIWKLWESLQWKKIWWQDINAKNIFWLIFAPVIPVFLLSMSLIIMQNFQGQFNRSITKESPTREFLGIDSTPVKNNPNIVCVDFRGLTETCYETDPETPNWSGFVNMIPWLFLSIFGIGLMWMLMKASMKATWLLAGVWSSVMKLGWQALGTIPVPGFGWASINSLMKSPQIGMSLAQEHYRNKNRRQEEATIEQLFRSWTTTSAHNSTSATSWFNLSNITNKKEVQQEFISSLNSTDPLASFQEALTKTGETTSATSFGTLSWAHQAQHVLDFIEEYDNPDDKSKFDDTRKVLINQILEPQFKTINETTDQATKDKLIESLTTTIKDNSYNKDYDLTTLTLYREYEDIVDDIITKLSTS